MPIYEYQCRRCEHCFEALVDGDEELNCPSCKAPDLERLLSIPARPSNTLLASKTGCDAAPGVPPCGPMCGRWPG